VGGSRTQRSGRAVIERWNGSSWARQAVPRGGLSAALFGIEGRSGRNAWAVGHRCGAMSCLMGPGFGSRTLVLRRQGGRWSGIPSPNPGTGGNWLTDIALSGRNAAWAVGASFNEGHPRKQPLVVHWDGDRWTMGRLPDLFGLDAELFAVSVNRPDDVWAVGRRCAGGCAPVLRSRPLVLHFNGNRWRVAPPPQPDGWAWALSGVAALGPAEVLASGWVQATPHASTRPLLVRWDGRGWRRIAVQHPGNQAELFDVEGVPGGGAWVVGTYGSGDPSQYRTLALRRREGTWRRVSSPNGAGRASWLTSVATADAGHAWAAGPSTGGRLALRWVSGSWRPSGPAA
jgi:hypothetical protein